MSEYDTSASTAGHFTANRNTRDKFLDELDGYLMMHANRSLPMVRNVSTTDALTLSHWAKAFIARHKTYDIPLTKVRFASGEMSVDDRSFNFRSISTLNKRDTIHRISMPEFTDAKPGLTLPLISIQRISLPEAAANTSLTEIAVAEIYPISDETAYNPALTLSVLRGASLLCQFVRS